MMRKWLPGILVLCALVISIATYSKLPARIPIHWGMDYEPNGWAGRPVGAFGLPVVMTGLWGMMLFAPTMDSRRENYPRFAESYAFVYVLILLAVLAVHVVSIAVALGYALPVRRVIPAILGCVCLGVGNVLPRIRANSFMGVRSTWALSDDRVWSRTQRLGGYLLFVAGALFILDAIVVSHITSVLSTIALIAAIAISYFYSYSISER